MSRTQGCVGIAWPYLCVCVCHVIETHLPTYCLWHLEPYRIHQDDLKLICMIWHYVCGTSPKSLTGAWSFGILKSTNMILWYELVKCVICNNWYVWDITALTGYCWLIVVIYINMLLDLILWYIIIYVDRYLANTKVFMNRKQTIWLLKCQLGLLRASRSLCF